MSVEAPGCDRLEHGRGPAGSSLSRPRHPLSYRLALGSASPRQRTCDPAGRSPEEVAAAPVLRAKSSARQPRRCEHGGGARQPHDHSPGNTAPETLLQKRRKGDRTKCDRPFRYEPGTDLLSPYDYHRPLLLNCCVRYGNRCFQQGMGTGNMLAVLAGPACGRLGERQMGVSESVRGDHG
jgi:hypothetical protein